MALLVVSIGSVLVTLAVVIGEIIHIVKMER